MAHPALHHPTAHPSGVRAAHAPRRHMAGHRPMSRGVVGHRLLGSHRDGRERERGGREQNVSHAKDS
jgi:hypothetical protein